MLTVTDGRSNQIVGIVGKKGCGKTTRAKAYIVTAQRRIIIDPLWEHKDGVIVGSFETLVHYVRPRRFHQYAVVLRSMDDDDALQTIELLTEGEPNNPPLPGVTVLLDEVDRYCSPTQIPEGLRKLVNYGRHFGVNVVWISRRPRQVHRDLTANADRLVIGTTQEPNDLDYLSQFVGEATIERARDLRLGEFITWPDDIEEGAHGEDVDSARGDTRPGDAVPGDGATPGVEGDLRGDHTGEPGLAVEDEGSVGGEDDGN